ncbi:hypothetical protein ACQ4M4_12940 [Leptolyngbya sp. AN02str]|uniref:hypothetical protein n=1 Tax=Leptolyngbya sp. AN02str TaxID=3423363 RepID=UPI003D31C469
MPGVTWKSFTMQQPNWSAEQLTAERLLNAGTQLDIAQFPFSDSVVVTLAAGAVTAGSNKTLALTSPLTNDIPAGTILDFGSGEFATLSSKAVKGSSSIAGVTLAADLEGGESATYRGTSGQITVASGTLVGRTYAERESGDGFGPATHTDDEFYIVAFQVERAEIDAGVTLVRHQTLVYEDQLPGWGTASADMKAKVRSLYQTIVSAG